MARTLADLTAGTLVYVDETDGGVTQHVPFIYLGLDESDHARLLRKYVTTGAQMRSGTSTSGSDVNYDGCPIDTFMTTTYMNRLDAATQAALVETDIKYVKVNFASPPPHELVTIQRKIFALSGTELGGTAGGAGSEGQSYLDALKAHYETNTDNLARRTTANSTSTSYSAYWTRSPLQNTSNVYFGRYGYIVGTNGAMQYQYVTYSSGNRPALSLLKTTPVSDDGAESIFLLPDGRATYWELDAKIKGDAFARRPIKAKLMLGDLSAFYQKTIRVCNNMDDNEPTWVECANNGVAELGTVKTAESWRMGVSVDLMANAEGAHIDAPQLIVELEEEI